MPSDRPVQRLEDMLDNIGRIRAYAGELDRDRYLADSMVQDAVERCFERICEAARKIGDGFDDAFPDAGFPELRDFGSVLRHDYDRINPALMWAFTRGRLDVLEAAARSILARLRADES